MATLKATKDKARFVSNTISQDVADGDWVDHEVITKYKLPEIVLDASTTTTSIESLQEITTGAKLKVYNATDGVLDRTAGTVTTTGENIGFTAIADVTLSNDNDTATKNSSGFTNVYADTSKSSGILYIEYAIDNVAGVTVVGISNQVSYNGDYFNLGSTYAIAIRNDGVYTKVIAGTSTAIPGNLTFTTGDIIGIVINFGASTVEVYLNSNSVPMFSVTGFTAPAMYPAISISNATCAVTMNWGATTPIYQPVGTNSFGEAPLYQAPITATSLPSTKAFFNKTIDTTLSAEATGSANSTEIIGLTVNSATSTTANITLASGTMTTSNSVVLNGKQFTPLTAVLDAGTTYNITFDEIGFTPDEGYIFLAGSTDIVPTVASDVFDGTDTFTRTYNKVTKTARDVEYGFVGDTDTEIVQVNINQNMEP